MSDRTKQLARINALLRKAESTDFPEEAEAFFARAQEMMTVLAVEEAELAGHRETESNPITVAVIEVRTPYAKERSMILAGVASANSCRTVILDKIGAWKIQLIGFVRDLERVELLYASLEIHAGQQMMRADRRGENAQRFQRSFLVAFGVRIGQRLREARDDVAGADNLPVLFDRSQLVDERVADLFPNLVRGPKMRINSASGYAAGKMAADRADLGQTRMTGQGAIR